MNGNLKIFCMSGVLPAAALGWSSAWTVQQAVINEIQVTFDDPIETGDTITIKGQNLVDDCTKVRASDLPALTDQDGAGCFAEDDANRVFSSVVLVDGVWSSASSASNSTVIGSCSSSASSARSFSF